MQESTRDCTGGEEGMNGGIASAVLRIPHFGTYTFGTTIPSAPALPHETIDYIHAVSNHPTRYGRQVMRPLMASYSEYSPRVLNSIFQASAR